MEKIKIIANFAYPETLEQHYFGAFKNLGYKVTKKSLAPADITVVVKWLPNLGFLSGKRIMIMPDSISRVQPYFDNVKGYFDYVFFAHNEQEIDNQKYFHLPFARNPQIHRYVPSKKDINVVFIGTCHRGHREFLTKIKDIKIYGNNWEGVLDTHYTTEKSKIYSRSKVVIDYALPGDYCTMRFYEALSCKVLLITNAYPNEFKPNKHFVLYSDRSELQSLINYYLEHGEEREGIALRGYEKVKGETYEKRVEQIMQLIDKSHS